MTVPQIDMPFADGIALQVMHIQRHGATRVHTHGFSELVIVLGGSGVHQSPAGDYRIGAGDVFVLHGNQAHGYRDTTELELVNILFNMDELALPLLDVTALPGYHMLFTLEPMYRLRDRFESRLRLTTDALKPVAELVVRLAREWEHRLPGWRFATLGLFMQLVTDLCRCYSHIEDPAAQSLLRLGRVIGYLEQHYSERLTLDDLAAVGCMSPRTLSREFAKAMGCPPIEYLIRVRINHAADLLRDGNQSITDVAFRVGFCDSSYFARQFQTLMGCSPRELRRSQ